MDANATSVVVDSNVVVYTILKTPEAARFRPHLEGKLVLISFQSVAELQFIACRRNWGPRRLEELRSMLESMVIIDNTADMTELWGALMCEQATSGRPIAVPDAWVATTAILAGVPLVTNDRDFDYIPSLAVLHAIDS